MTAEGSSFADNFSSNNFQGSDARYFVQPLEAYWNAGYTEIAFDDVPPGVTLAPNLLHAESTFHDYGYIHFSDGTTTDYTAFIDGVSWLDRQAAVVDPSDELMVWTDVAAMPDNVDTEGVSHPIVYPSQAVVEVGLRFGWAGGKVVGAGFDNTGAGGHVYATSEAGQKPLRGVPKVGQLVVAIKGDVVTVTVGGEVADKCSLTSDLFVQPEQLAGLHPYCVVTPCLPDGQGGGPTFVAELSQWGYLFSPPLTTPPPTPKMHIGVGTSAQIVIER